MKNKTYFMKIKNILYLMIFYIKIKLAKSYFIPEIQNSIYDDVQIYENNKY